MIGRAKQQPRLMRRAVRLVVAIGVGRAGAEAEALVAAGRGEFDMIGDAIAEFRFRTPDELVAEPQVVAPSASERRRVELRRRALASIWAIGSSLLDEFAHAERQLEVVTGTVEDEVHRFQMRDPIHE
jgi:hypothetical protein